MEFHGTHHVRNQAAVNDKINAQSSTFNISVSG